MSNNKQSKRGLGLISAWNYWSKCSSNLSLTSLFASGALLVACSSQTYQSEPIDPQLIAQQRVALEHHDPAFKAYLQTHGLSTENWPLARFDLKALTLTALYFNPTIKLARSRIEIAQAGETIAAQRLNPTLNFPDEPRDTVDFYGLIFDFIFERQAKRQARQNKAQAQREASELELAQQAWAIYAKLHSNFIEYYGVSHLGALLETQRTIVENSLLVLEQRLAAGETSEFELSSLRLETQRVALRLSNQQFLRNDAFHQLIADTGLQADKFKHVDFVFSDLEKHLQPDSITLEELQVELLNSRFDIQQKLAEHDAAEAKLKLEIEKRYPDVTISPGLLFEEGQALWVLAAAGTLPLFHNNDGQIQRALAERKQKQYEFIQLQTALIQELARKKQNYQDMVTAYNQSHKLFATLQARSQEIEKQYKLGYSDKLVLLRSQLEIEKARQAMFQIELEVMRAAARLEAVTQSPLYAGIKAIDFKQFQPRTETNP